MPNWSVGVETGQIGIVAAGSVMDQVSPIHVEGTEGQGDAGFGQSSLDEQLFLTDLRSISQIATGLGAGIRLDAHADHTLVDREPALVPNGHTIDPQLDPLIGYGE